MRFRKPREITKIFTLMVCSLSFVLFFSSLVYANWSIYKKVQIRNSQKNYLRFDTSNGKNIKIWFILKKKDNGVFSKKLPVYRVDNNEVHKICRGKAENGLKIKKGRYIRWVISDGKKPSKELKELINGKEVVFQFYRDDGKIMETVFPLEGLKETISEILDKQP